MAGRRALVTAITLWEVARFFLFVSFLGQRLSPEVPGALQAVPWLLAAASGGLVVPAAGALYVLLPRPSASFLGLLRIAKALGIGAVVLLFATGAVAPATEVPLLTIAGLPVTQSTLTFGGVLAADLLVLGILCGIREEEDGS